MNEFLQGCLMLLLIITLIVLLATALGWVVGVLLEILVFISPVLLAVAALYGGYLLLRMIFG